MARIAKTYRTLWGLSGNPFPDHAIATAGDRHQPFYEQLHPGVGPRMARAILGTSEATPRVSFLWSLGHGEEARGYGKTRQLLWFAEHVNEDYGRKALKQAGRPADSEKVLAAYAAFSTVDGLSLNNLLFDVVLNIARSQGVRLVALLAGELDKGRKPEDIYEGAAQRLRKSDEKWDVWLLHNLSSNEPTDWVEYLESFGQWHKVRNGRDMLRSLVAFLNELGIDRLLVLVDQVEDFASYSTATYKLQRDFHRLALLCSTDKLLHRRITFLLTMHPRAARILSRYWSERELGPVTPDEGAENVVLLGAMSKHRFVALVTAYLASVRVEPSRDPLTPFTEEAIDFIHEHDRGRPGYCLHRLFIAMDLAAAEGMKNIGRDLVMRYLQGATS
jgi:hypothetical protein